MKYKKNISPDNDQPVNTPPTKPVFTPPEKFREYYKRIKNDQSYEQ